MGLVCTLLLVWIGASHAGTAGSVGSSPVFADQALWTELLRLSPEGPGVPLADLDLVVIIVKAQTQMRLYRRGEELGRYPVALGQAPVGHKVRRGDNKTPEGAYRVVEKSRGPFTGPAAAYFGVAWMRLDYPSPADARLGLERGLVSATEVAAIEHARRNDEPPIRTTKLGSGIGLHGWAGDWPDTERALTWGCISVRNEDLDLLYDVIPVGTWVFVAP